MRQCCIPETKPAEASSIKSWLTWCTKGPLSLKGLCPISIKSMISSSVLEPRFAEESCSEITSDATTSIVHAETRRSLIIDLHYRVPCRHHTVHPNAARTSGEVDLDPFIPLSFPCCNLLSTSSSRYLVVCSVPLIFALFLWTLYPIYPKSPFPHTTRPGSG